MRSEKACFYCLLYEEMFDSMKMHQKLLVSKKILLWEKLFVSKKILLWEKMFVSKKLYVKMLISKKMMRTGVRNIKVKVIEVLDGNRIEADPCLRGVLVIKTVNVHESEADRNPTHQAFVDVAIARKLITICTDVTCVIHSSAAKIHFGAHSAQMVFGETVLTAYVGPVRMVVLLQGRW